MAKTRYIYFGNQYIGEADENNTVTKRYVNEPDMYTNLIGQHDVGSGNNRYPHYDAVGSTRSVTDDTETVTDTFTYDAWGNVLSRTGAIDLPFQYVGERGYYRDEETETYHVMARFYAPQLIRMTTYDVFYATSIYIYSNNSPSNYIDISGLFPASAHFQQNIDVVIPGEKGGHFNIHLRECDDQDREANEAEECCCTHAKIRYTPSKSDKEKYEKICLVQYAYEERILFMCPDIIGDWHYDKQQEQHNCYSTNQPYAKPSLDDAPGYGPPTGCRSQLFCGGPIRRVGQAIRFAAGCPYPCDVLQETQRFVTCAIGRKPDGSLETIGCRSWGHICNFHYIEIYGRIECCVTCTRSPYGDAGDDAPPQLPRGPLPIPAGDPIFQPNKPLPAIP